MNFYRSPEELEAPVEPLDANDDGRNELHRRDFLKAAGFTVAAVAATSCSRPPVEKAIPFADAPEEVVPGRAYWMASTCHGCSARCGVLVKCRDGRPIKLEGNPEHPLSRGGLCAVGQATVLGLYDAQRLAGPRLNGETSDWKPVDTYVASMLQRSRIVRVLSSTLASPTAKRVIESFLSRFPDGRHVVYDVPSASAIADAHLSTHGVRAVPHYRFDLADTVVSLDADFLGTWISPVEFTKGWSAKRPHVTQLEARMSLTGSNADERIRLHPGEIGEALSCLSDPAAQRSSGPALEPSTAGKLAILRDRLVKGRALVVCGSNRLEDQIATNLLNEKLGAYGTTIRLDEASHQREGNDSGLAALVDELRAGTVDALFVLEANPVYDLPAGDELPRLLGKVPLVVSFASHFDETARYAHVVCPDHHPLESWRDSMPVDGVYSVTQPAIAPLRSTRAAIESFAAWSGVPASAYDLIRETKLAADWDKALHDGFAVAAVARSPRVSVSDSAEPPPRSLPLAALGVGMTRRENATAANALQLVLHPSNTMLDGRHAHNAWLHELPDPVTKVTWDNYASLSPATAKRLGVKDGDVVRLSGGKQSVELPAFVQPGQHDGVVAIALGYGRIGTDRFAKVGPKWLLGRTHLSPGETVGRRVVQLGQSVTITKTGAKHPLASTQLHATIDRGRPTPVRESEGAAPLHAAAASHDLWPAKPRGQHQWAMAIDLSKCTGCSGCIVACQAENNVPVVGKDEVVRAREMHWIRIDRYYSGEGDETRVAHQPMMCQHCGNAPCETVCPVLATVHSEDGLNQQVYNRCVGTRYCANNCPYKVRRFNWFDYPREDRLANLVLNPDVTVRSRGVMEKCSMCVQRIEEARIESKVHGTKIADGTVRTACQQSCPADAIVFGDALDPASAVSRARQEPGHYVLLEELNVKPAVGYLPMVRKA